MPYGKQRDRNQTPIVRAAARLPGFRHWDTSRYGDGFPDVIVQLGDVFRLVEVKRPGNGLTDDEEKFHAAWPEHVAVVRTLEEMVGLFGLSLEAYMEQAGFDEWSFDKFRAEVGLLDEWVSRPRIRKVAARKSRRSL